MLGEHRDYHRGIFRSLALVNGRRVGRHQHVQLAESISDGPAIEAHNDLARVGVNIVDVADIAVVDFLFVVVLDLHHLVAGGKGPAEPLDLAGPFGVLPDIPTLNEFVPGYEASQWY